MTEYGLLLLLIAAGLAVFFINGVREEKKKKERFISSLREGYGGPPRKDWKEADYAALDGYHSRHKGSFEIDGITWNDLGMDALFRRMDYTLSKTGAEYLYHLLKTPCFSPEELAGREEKIRYFMEREEERIRLQRSFAALGPMGKYSLYDYLDNLELLGKRSSAKHYLCIAALAAAVVLLFLSPGPGLAAVLAAVFFNLFSYFREKAGIEPYITGFSYIMRLLKCAGELSALKIPMIREELSELSALRAQMKKFSQGSYLVMSMGHTSANPMELALDYIRMLFHPDLIKFNQMHRQLCLHREKIDRMLTIWGFLEAVVSIGAYRASLPQWCVPEFTASHAVRMEDGYHPMLKRPVANSVSTKKGVLLTGSNASGKSTFLKTAAVNALTAQTIHTCHARSFCLEPCRLFTSMSLRDDLAGGESYYIVEIKALKRILDAVGEEGRPPVLCFVDEVLRGTNTVERIAASTELLLSLTGRRVLCFAATHDIELTRLLEERYDNYHFEEEIQDHDISFSYQLKAGRARTRNAIRLLRMMGYEEAVVKRAAERAERFVREGGWMK